MNSRIGRRILMEKKFLQWYQNFTYNVVWLRKEHNLSKTKMANLLGISVQCLNRIEKGELPPKLSIVIVFKIQENFSVHPKDLFENRWN